MRKLLPALYNLAHEGSLPERFNLIGVSRARLATTSSGRRCGSRSSATPAGGRTRRCSTQLLRQVRYVQGAFDDPGAYERLAARCDEFDERGAACRSTASSTCRRRPSFFPVIVSAARRGRACNAEEG